MKSHFEEQNRGKPKSGRAGASEASDFEFEHGRAEGHCPRRCGGGETMRLETMA